MKIEFGTHIILTNMAEPVKLPVSVQQCKAIRDADLAAANKELEKCNSKWPGCDAFERWDLLDARKNARAQYDTCMKKALNN